MATDVMANGRTGNQCHANTPALVRMHGQSLITSICALPKKLADLRLKHIQTFTNILI